MLLLLFWMKADWPAGGQDSWNHYLYARFALKHPELMGDQWGKPFFTVLAIPFAQFGIQGIYFMNIACTLGSAWFCYLAARRLGMRFPWMVTLFFLFQPIVFANTISGLTEPLNAFALSVFLYLVAAQKFIPAAILASFFPFFRSEGFILLGCSIPYFLVRRQFKIIPLLFSGTLLISVLGAISSGDIGWILTHNPYFKQEVEKRFDPGHGDFFHYLHSQKSISGLIVTVLAVVALVMLITHTVYLLRRRTPEEKSRYCYWLIAPMFLAFFIAHSWLWYSGTYGSHGLIRVFLVTSPLLALLAQYATDKILALDIKNLNRIYAVVISVGLIYTAYKGSDTPWPWKKEATVKSFPGEANINKALKFISDRNLASKTLIHQLPWLNAELSLDPWEAPEKSKTFYIWSIDKREGKDWMPDSAVVLWDNFHARRDAPMPLHEMRALTEYHELAYFPANDSIYDVRVFIKSKRK